MLWGRLTAVILGGVCVAIADAAIKRAVIGHLSRFASIATWIAILVLYAAQVGFFAYAFMRRLDLGIAGTLQMVAYSVATVLIGLTLFHERLSSSQLLGVLIAVVGCVLMVRS